MNEIKKLSTAYLTDNGNLISNVSKDFKRQVIGKLNEVGFEMMPNGRLALVLAEIGGKYVTANVDLSIGYGTNFDKKTGTKTIEKVDIPNLFE